MASLQPTIPTAGLSRSGTTVTVNTAINHNLVVGNQFFLTPGEANFPAGVQTVSTITSISQFTYNDTNTVNGTTNRQHYISPNFRKNNLIQLLTTSNHNIAVGQQLIADNLLAENNGSVTGSVGVFTSVINTEQKDYAATTLLQDGRILVAGGHASGINNQNVYTFNTDNTLTLQGTLSYSLFKGAAVTLNSGKALIIDGNLANTPICNIFDPTTNTIISTVPPNNVKRSYHTATVMADSRVLVTGGFNFVSFSVAAGGLVRTGGSTVTVTINNHPFLVGQIINVSPGEALFPAGNKTITFITTNTFLYTETGTNGSSTATQTISANIPINSCEIFDPSTFSWQNVANMRTPRAGHAAALLQDGRVLVCGGYKTSPNTSISLSEIYNPINNFWTATGNMTSSKYDHNLIYINIAGSSFSGGGGMVFAMGGNTGIATLKSVELYNTTTQIWGNLAFGGSNSYQFSASGAAVMPDGRILVAGGIAGITANNNVSVFDPLNAVWNNDINTTLSIAKSACKAILRPDNTIVITPGTGGNWDVFTSNNIVFSSGGLNGIQTTASGTANNVIFYNTNDFNTQSSINVSQASITAFQSTHNTKFAGPFIYDPKSFGPAITATSTTLNQNINQNQNYSLITVNSTSQFPNTGGLLAFGFGTSNAVFPVKYLFVASPTQLAIDSSFVFPNNLTLGTSITLLAKTGAFVPAAPQNVGSFYLTDSISGRISASATIDLIAAAGVLVNKTILYPGSVGLGGGDIPTTSSGPKLNDIIYIFGSSQDLISIRGF